MFRSGGDSSGAIRGGECWPEGELARSWAAFEVAAGAAVRRALEEDARNVTACASDGPALQRVLAAEAAQLSAMLSGCPGNVSAYVFQRMVLGAQSAEARALELVLGDDVAEIPGRKLLGWLARLKRKAGRAVTTAVRTTGRVAGNPRLYGHVGVCGCIRMTSQKGPFMGTSRQALSRQMFVSIEVEAATVRGEKECFRSLQRARHHHVLFRARTYRKHGGGVVVQRLS